MAGTVLNQLRLRVKAAALQLTYHRRDAQWNRHSTAATQRFLIVRHSAKQPYKYHDFLHWIEEEFPEIRSRIELRLLPCPVDDWSRYALCVPWLQDPVEDWSPSSYALAQQLAADCDRHGIPIINRVDSLSRAMKSVAALRIARTEVRTPRTIPIYDVKRFRETLCGLKLPLMVREDRGHGGPLVLMERKSDLDRLPLNQFRHPVAVEFIDVRSRDSYYRKYRYLVTGNRGVTCHLRVSTHWESRPEHRTSNAATRQEEFDYLNVPEPNRDAFHAVCRELGFDVAMIDYSYDRAGQLVVWEAKPYPDLSCPNNPEQAQTHPYVRRSFAALTRFYLERAGLAVPARLQELLVSQDVATPSSHRSYVIPFPQTRAA
jgi:hypothetical protein